MQREIGPYAACASGVAGLVITGACAIAFPQCSASMKEPGMPGDNFLAGLTALADAVHEAGSRLCVQSAHHDKVDHVDIANERPELAQ